MPRVYSGLSLQLDVASTKFGFESATIMCGKIVNQDTSLGHVHTTPGASDVS